MMYVIIGDLHLMIYLKTIRMKKKIDMESPVSHIIYFFIYQLQDQPFFSKKNFVGVPLFVVFWFNLDPTHLPPKWPMTYPIIFTIG